MAKQGVAHPYIPSAGMIVQTFGQLRKMFPGHVDADTLKKLSLAPKNESMVINVLRFLGFIDEAGKKTERAAAVFSKHQDDAFAGELEKVVRTAYAELFETIGQGAWESDRSSLIGFFRVHDETSELTATRQAIAFETLASLSGHGEMVKSKATQTKAAVKTGQSKKTAGKTSQGAGGTGAPQTAFVGKDGVALTVRIEINLPAQGDQETYDRIFQSSDRIF